MASEIVLPERIGKALMDAMEDGRRMECGCFLCPVHDESLRREIAAALKEERSEGAFEAIVISAKVGGGFAAASDHATGLRAQAEAIRKGEA